jgi:uncharacterized protein YjbI with pentapeptide repeats
MPLSSPPVIVAEMSEETDTHTEEQQTKPRPWRPWRPSRRKTRWRVLWAVGMVIALMVIALLVGKRYPGIWEDLSRERVAALIGIGVALTVVIVLLALGGASLGWTGFGEKNLWDWLQLLIVPLALVGVGLWFTMQQDARQQQIEDQRAQDAALQAYLDQMSQLMLEHNLRDADSEARTLATARTLTVLQSLDDPQRKKNVLRFLYEADLIDHPKPIVSLEGANLQDINLEDGNLSGGPFLQGPHRYLCTLEGEVLGFPGSIFGGDLADLSGANLSRADLREAILSGVDLKGANLSGADLRGVMMPPDFHNAKQTGWLKIEAECATADIPIFETYPQLPEGTVATNLEGAFLTDGTKMQKADLRAANLRGSRLSAANLSDALVEGANLEGAKLKEAILEDASLIGANLEHATVRDKQLNAAKSIEGAIMPNGTITSEEFEPALSFSVSDDGWRLAYPDTSDALFIADLEGNELIFASPLRVLDPSNLSDPKEVPAPENAEEWASWFQNHPHLDSSEPVQASVGGASGVRIDVTATSVPNNYRRNYCAGPPPCVPLFLHSNNARVIASSVGYKDRFVIVDVEGESVVIDVAAPVDEFDAVLPKAQKVLETVEWVGSE